MSKCPFCNSIRVVKVPGGDVSICLACESLLNTIDGKSKQTVFDRITSSHEALADKLVYKTLVVGNNRVTYSCWRSTITEESYRTKKEASDATLEKLKEV